MALASTVMAFGLLIFWGVSLRNVLQNKGTGERAQPETPMSLGFILALTGSLLLFAESLAFIALEFSGNLIISHTWVQFLGLFLFFSGCLFHAWSVYARGKYSTSWSMGEGHRLILDPPYNIVRHPSYVGYMLMIGGVTFVWMQWFNFIPWIAIPGYILVSRKEEEMLIERFGDAYRRYKKRVGAFIPKL